MLLHETYIVCNSQNINHFKKIEHFKLDLGKQLLDVQKRGKTFQPGDVKVQTHLIFHDDLIMKCGSIGTLGIYTSNLIDKYTIRICNGQLYTDYKLDPNTSLYDNMNTMLDLFMETNNMIPKEPLDVSKDDEEKENQNIQENIPSKPLSEMNMEERIAYARSRN